MKLPILLGICSVGSPSSCLYIEASCRWESPLSLWCLLLQYNSLLDGEVLVPAKGAEALDFLFREVRVCGWRRKGRKGSFGESDILLRSRIGV